MALNLCGERSKGKKKKEFQEREGAKKNVRESEEVRARQSLNRCPVQEFSKTCVDTETRKKGKSACLAIHACFYSRQGKMQEYYPLLEKKPYSVSQPRSQDSLLRALT